MWASFFAILAYYKVKNMVPRFNKLLFIFFGFLFLCLNLNGQDPNLIKNIASIQNDSAVKKIIAETYGHLVKKKEYATMTYFKYASTKFSRIVHLAGYDSNKRQAFFDIQTKNRNKLIDYPYLDSISRGYKQKYLGVFFISFPFQNNIIVEFQLINTFYGYDCSNLVSSKRIQFLFGIEDNGRLRLMNYCLIDKVNKCRVLE